MSALLQWAFGLCAAMVALGLCRMLLPGSGMEKTFRFIVSVFFLCVLLSPVALRFPEIMMEVPAQTQSQMLEHSRRLDEMVHRQALGIAQTRLRQIVEEKLSQLGIKAQSIAINFTTGDQGEVLLESIELTLSISHKQDEAVLIRYLETELGSSVRLHYV